MGDTKRGSNKRLVLRLILALLTALTVGLIVSVSSKETKYYRLQKYGHKTEVSLSDFVENSNHYNKKQELNLIDGILTGVICFTLLSFLIISKELNTLYLDEVRREKRKLIFRRVIKFLIGGLLLFSLVIIGDKLVNSLNKPVYEKNGKLKSPDNLSDLYYFLVEHDKDVDWSTNKKFILHFENEEGINSRRRLHGYLQDKLSYVHWGDWEVFNEKYKH